MPKTSLKSKIGIIGGTGLSDVKSVKVSNVVFVSRHGKGIAVPPHKVDYKKHLLYLKSKGVKRVLAFNSVGSLKKEIVPGSFLVVSDFIDFNPPTIYDKKPSFITPCISEDLRKLFVKSLKRLKLNFYSKGIYFNTKGPRLETKAEIDVIKRIADVVGMTMAKEATIANELGLEYACLCSVDNYANGITSKKITEEDILLNQKKNKFLLKKIIEDIIQ